MTKRMDITVTEEELKRQQEFIKKVQEINAGKPLHYHIVTYGCQMNVHDSEKLSGMLVQMGYEWTDELERADLILFNTCCVREHAEMRVYGNVGALRPMKENNPELIIGVCGCMMQQKEVSSFIAKRFSFVDLIFGTHNLHTFPELLWKAIHSRETVYEILDDEGRIVEDIPVQRKKGSSAWVTIMYGCNNYCTYCIVPYVRGRERSRTPSHILQEVEALAVEGYKEVTLLGQNVNSYGKDLKDGISFAELLRSLNNIEGFERIRYMTSHPKDLSDDLIHTIAQCKKVCKHLHLPVQAGSNKILEKMNRKYTREEYMALVERIRNAVPGIALTTDIIVGFPGETEDDFQETLDLIKRVRFDAAFTFMYSKRTGTKAAAMEDQIDDDVKKERLARLIDLQNSITREINQEYIGKTVEVLIEGYSKKDPERLTGRTDTGKTVNFPGDESSIGSIVNVRIKKAKTFVLEGELID